MLNAALRATAFVLTLALFAAPTAQAYTLYYCDGKLVRWPNGVTSFVGGADSFDTVNRQAALMDVRSAYFAQPGNINIDSISFNGTKLAVKNNVNEIWFTDDEDVIMDSPARCIMYWTCTKKSAKMTETDIVFNSDTLYSTSTLRLNLNTYGGVRRPLRTTAMHEMGHALGLGHNATTYNIMGSDWNHIHANGDNTYAYPGEDAAHGLVALYGARPAAIFPNDIGVTHWKFSKADGEYSAHTQTRIYEPGDDPRPLEAYEGELKRTLVRAGQQYEVQFTYENNGRDNLTNIACAMYLSTDARITTMDRELRTFTLNLARNTPSTVKILVTLPNDLIPGQTLFIGPVIDRNNQISEFSEANNATYLPVRVLTP